MGPVHCDIIVGKPRVTHLHLCTLARQKAIEFCAFGADKEVHLSVLPTALRPPNVKGVESVSQEKENDVTPKQHRSAAWNGRDMHALGHTGSTKADIVGDAL